MNLTALFTKFKRNPMATVTDNLILKGVRGRIGELVIKQYANRIVITKVPDMDGIKPSPKQKAHRKIFGAAVKYARHIAKHPLKRKEYAAKIKPGETVYHYAMKEFYQLHKQVEAINNLG
jgi:hypothetical protein